jgi:acyl dehydratase
VVAQEFPVERGHIMMFARAIGDPNPIYSDPAYAESAEVGSIIAPPTFAIAAAQFDPDYPLRPEPGTPWYGSGRGPGLALEGAGGLHAEQHFVYHRLVQPGDVLSAHVENAPPWEKAGKSGRLVFSEQITEFRDQQGALVITMRSVGVQREENR